MAHRGDFAGINTSIRKVDAGLVTVGKKEAGILWEIYGGARIRNKFYFHWLRFGWLGVAVCIFNSSAESTIGLIVDSRSFRHPFVSI